jgi:hypothetical protein
MGPLLLGGLVWCRVVGIFEVFGVWEFGASLGASLGAGGTEASQGGQSRMVSLGAGGTEAPQGGQST